jgi:hypothetical protein
MFLQSLRRSSEKAANSSSDMAWRKLGCIFSPRENYAWMHSHAANPFAEQRANDVLRVYFTCRNVVSQSHIGYVDLDASFNVLSISEEPVLGPGEPGMFDDSGTAMGYLLQVNSKKYLYYLGWNLKVTVPWLNTIGLAVWNEATARFEKKSRAPVMDRSDEDPFSISYPSILQEHGVYKMWYGSNLKWGKDQSEMDHIIKYAESADGIQWKRSHQVVIGLEHKNEYALSKPFVLRDPDRYRMWYSYRANGHITTYRIGYAESQDGNTWTRMDDKAGIDVSAEGWDSEMICYPCVFDFQGKRYMLYNGNGYGRSGFGLAILDR